MSPPRYKSPELPPAEQLAKVTADYKRSNDERAAKLARAPELARPTALDEQSENARVELLALCDMGLRYDQEKDDPKLRLDFYAGLREAVREFCTALGSRTSARRNDALLAMREAIASLDAYRGVR